MPPLHFSPGAGPFLEFQLLSEAESLRRSCNTCFNACTNSDCPSGLVFDDVGSRKGTCEGEGAFGVSCCESLCCAVVLPRLRRLLDLDELEPDCSGGSTGQSYRDEATRDGSSVGSSLSGCSAAGSGGEGTSSASGSTDCLRSRAEVRSPAGALSALGTYSHVPSTVCCRVGCSTL